MASVEVASPSAAAKVQVPLIAAVSIALVTASSASATGFSDAVEYRSAFANYRHFDAWAPAADWRAANDTIRNGTDGAGHGHPMPAMPIAEVAAPAPGGNAADRAAPQTVPASAPPHEGDEPSVATPHDHRERRE